MLHFSHNHLLHSSQFGFRNNYSTTYALQYFTDKIATNFNNNANTLAIYLDLSKAFDSVNHDILIKKLSGLYKFNDNSCLFIKNYLSNREIYISFNNKISSKKNFMLV